MSNSKYHNKYTTVDGIAFASKREANRWMELRWMERAGEIECLNRQVKFVLQPGFTKNGKRYREIAYIADFTYYDRRTKQNIVEDAKGMKTEVYKLKKKLFEHRYPELTIKEV